MRPGGTIAIGDSWRALVCREFARTRANLPEFGLLKDDANVQVNPEPELSQWTLGLGFPINFNLNDKYNCNQNLTLNVRRGHLGLGFGVWVL